MIENGGLGEERHRLYWFAWIPAYKNDIFHILRDNRVSIPLNENFRMRPRKVDPFFIRIIENLALWA